MAGAEGTVIACHSKDEFDAQMSKAYNARKLLVVIDFMRPGCPFGQKIAPVFAACAKEYATKAVFLEVNIEQLEEVASKYCVKEVTPTFVFIDTMEDVTLESFVGAYPDKLRNTVKEFIALLYPESASFSQRRSYSSNK